MVKKQRANNLDKKWQHLLILIKKNSSGWLIMLPSILLFAFFLWQPLIGNIRLSFVDNLDHSKFVLFDNYKDVFKEPLFLSALSNTFKYIFWSIIIGFFIPIFLGLLLSEVVHGKTFFRVMIYLPCIISGVAVAFLFSNLYGSEPYSVLNALFKAFSLEPILWKDDPKLVIPLIVVAMTWRGAGGTVLIYLSTLQTIDSTLYEAARIDGANMFARIRHVTFPHLKTAVTTLFILQIISVFQVFYEPMIIGQGNENSISLMYLSWKYAFDKGNDAMGAAVGVLLSLIIIIFTLVYFLIVRLMRGSDKRA